MKVGLATSMADHERMIEKPVYANKEKVYRFRSDGSTVHMNKWVSLEKKSRHRASKSAMFCRHDRVDAARFLAGGARSLEKRAVVGACPALSERCCP